jgi:hypothetical protein
MYSKLIRLALNATVLCSVATSIASAQSDSNTNSDIRGAYIESYGQSPNTSILQVLSSVFQQFDRKGDGIDLADIGAFEKQQAAQMNAGLASQWLRMDLNADLKITRDEVESSMNQYRRRVATSDAQTKRINGELKKQVDTLFLADADSNGTIEGTELYRPQRQGENQNNYAEKATAFVRALLKIDPNGDGTITETEAAYIASQALEGVDTQIAEKFVQRQTTQSGGMSANCPKLDIAKDSTLVLLGAYEGTSLSTVTVAGQDETTHGATLLIEEGTTPITLVVTSYSPMIWQVKGATQRIAKVVLSGVARQNSNEKVSAGVVGIDRSKVQFINAANCLRNFYDVKSPDGLITKAYLQKMINRAPDVFLGRYDVGIVAIPSGRGTSKEINSAERADLKAKAAVQYYTIGPDGKPLAFNGTKERPLVRSAEGLLFDFNSDGLMDFKLSDVVSDAKAEAYEVYPEHAGLLQLVGQGKLERMSADHGGWKVKSATRFPAGLAGAMMTSFFVPKGVKMPEGNPGHSRVFSEETASYIDFN